MQEGDFVEARFQLLYGAQRHQGLSRERPHFQILAISLQTISVEASGPVPAQPEGIPKVQKKLFGKLGEYSQGAGPHKEAKLQMG